DAAGSAYVTGFTASADFPGTANSPIQSMYAGGTFSSDGISGDAFVTKLNAAGTALIYSTYLGGSGNDIGQGIAVDIAGNAYATGWTKTPGSGFPGTAGSLIQSTYGGSSDALGLEQSGGDGFVTKITTNLPFAAFKAKAEIDVRHRPHHDQFEGHHRRQKKDEFEMTAIFTLGPNNNGIAPLTEAVTVQVGAFATTIPAGSFTQKKGRFIFEGVIDGVKLEAVLRSLILGDDYKFTVEGKGADLTGTENPVTVSLTIGDDSSSKTITAKIK
ncbi:MAG: SBBP repeat-containing protein, partial [Nitrospirota bacterium]